jgi:predicted nucleic acid-binding protein
VGTLTLPASGVVYVDTQIIIYSVEKHPDYWLLLRPLWAASRAGSIDIVSSELALLETLVGPLKNTDTFLATTYEQLLTSTDMRLIPISTTILKTAARLRAEWNLKTPDALHAATALAARCTLFLTNDTDFHRVPDLPFVILSDIAKD